MQSRKNWNAPSVKTSLLRPINQNFLHANILSVSRLQKWLRQQIGRGLSCPNCRVITECPNNNIDRLPSNLAHKRLGDILKAHGRSNKDPDLESKEQNVCKRHDILVKFYCEPCEICICSECAIMWSIEIR